jgi:hypothetical protein
MIVIVRAHITYEFVATDENGINAFGAISTAVVGDPLPLDQHPVDDGGVEHEPPPPGQVPLIRHLWSHCD